MELLTYRLSDPNDKSKELKENHRAGGVQLFRQSKKPWTPSVCPQSFLDEMKIVRGG